jgi:cation diffusion facilitator CzcD-associated flavoprotein CzcO
VAEAYLGFSTLAGRGEQTRSELPATVECDPYSAKHLADAGPSRPQTERDETMTETAPADDCESESSQHFDVAIIGAGISGIGAAYHLKTQCPSISFVILEAKNSFGGTWITHRYPGVRSDSDLYTFGYRFKPWIGKPIANASEILAYLGEVIDENGLDAHIRYRHRIWRARWSSADNLWTLEGSRESDGAAVRVTVNFLWMCQGYYRHEKGYMPEWAGMESFEGRIVHPQSWPDDIDCTGKNVVVIGSGATAATLIPAIAERCSHVTMLQRSPTYYITARNASALADTLRELEVNEEWIHEIIRRKVLFDQAAFTRRCFSEPEAVKKDLLSAVRAYLGEDYDVETHFSPKYRPWRQRVAFIPDGDLFQAIRSKKASVVTDEIERFTTSGILTKSGKLLEADIIVTATGFNLNVLGDIDFAIDGQPLSFSDRVTYRGIMFAGVPNMAWVFGYFRSSWTLRVDLVGDFVCRLLNHMKGEGFSKVVPTLRPEDEDMPLLPWMDPEDFNPGYVLRGAHLLPKRGNKSEWRHSHDYEVDKETLAATDLSDGTLVYG